MKNIILIISVALIVFSSCTEKVETNYVGKTDNLLVVTGGFSTDTTAHKIILTRTVDFNATDINTESGATVTISDLTSNERFVLEEAEDGIYCTDSSVFGQSGHTYRLDVVTISGDKYFAESAIREVTDIDSIEVRFEEYEETTERFFYIVYFYGQEPEGKGDYYRWNLYMNDSLYNDTLTEGTFESDEFVDGNYISELDIEWLAMSEVKEDTLVCTVEIESLTEEYFNYLYEVHSETVWKGGPFDSTPANVSTNIQGDKEAKGFFATTMKKRATTVYIRTEEEKIETGAL